MDDDVAAVWYAAIQDQAELEQGDLIFNCVRFSFSPAFAEAIAAETAKEGLKSPIEVSTLIRPAAVIVLSQSCDLVLDGEGKSALDDVLVAPIHSKEEWLKSNPKTGAWGNALRGRTPSVAALRGCHLEGLEFGPQVVDFASAFSLPSAVVMRLAKGTLRPRLLPPYREHIAQAFARYVGRVALPENDPYDF
jgi:hypothetical protein